MTQPGTANDDSAQNPRVAADAAVLVALGRRVRRLRLLAELTQAELAAATGMSRSFISLVEHGDSSLQVFRLWRLADALRVPVAALLPDPPGYADPVPGLTAHPSCAGSGTQPADPVTQTRRSPR